jgi:hypothetical protein|tara:strand:+ start:139 stop:507 length:369 start_codon:yes stop_codon:yes gene_type:complete
MKIQIPNQIEPTEIQMPKLPKNKQKPKGMTRHYKLSQAKVLEHFVGWTKENPNGAWGDYHAAAKSTFGRNKVSTSEVHKNRLYNINARLSTKLKIPKDTPAFETMAKSLGLKLQKPKKKSKK